MFQQWNGKTIKINICMEQKKSLSTIRPSCAEHTAGFRYLHPQHAMSRDIYKHLHTVQWEPDSSSTRTPVRCIGTIICYARMHIRELSEICELSNYKWSQNEKRKQ